jgi:hypothetical protein
VTAERHLTESNNALAAARRAASHSKRIEALKVAEVEALLGIAALLRELVVKR